MSDLPPWLRGMTEDPEEENNENLSWSGQAEKPSGQTDDLSMFDWGGGQGDSAPASGHGLTGALPWNAQASDSDDRPQAGDSTGALPWQRGEISSSGPAKTGMTGMLPWNAQASDPDDFMPPPVEEPSPTPIESHGAADLDDVFDDWLGSVIDGTDTDEPAAEPEPAFSEPAQAESEFADDDWLNSFGASDDTSPEPEAAANSEPNFDNWLSGGDEPAQAEPEFADDDWLNSFGPSDHTPPQPEPAANSEPNFDNWLSGGDEPAQAESVPDDDWLNSFGPSDDTSPEPEAAANSEPNFDSWLSEDSEPAQAESDDWLRSGESFGQAEPAQEMTYEEWARQNESEAETAEEDALNWMSEQPSFSATDDMTYEEWDRQQQADENRATAAPDIPLPDLEPDVLGSIGGTGPISADYVPEWFMGVEELDTADAPDWLKDVPIAGVATGSLPPPPPPPALSDMALPDLDSITGGVPDDLLPDFGDILGDDPAPSPSPSRLKRVTGTQPISSSDLDQAFGASDDASFDDLFGDVPLSDEAEESDEPDWLRGYEAPAETPAPPPLPVAQSDDMGWMNELDFNDIPAPPSPDPEEALLDDFAGLELPDIPADDAPATPEPVSVSGSDDDFYDLDALLGSAPLPVTRSAPAASSNMDDLAFDESFLSGFDYSRDGELPQAVIEELAEAEDIPEWMRQQMESKGDQVFLKAGGVQSGFEQVPPMVLSPELRSLRERLSEMMSQPPAIEDQVMADGPFSGVEGALSLPMDIMQPAGGSFSENYDLTDTQEIRLRKLRNLVETVQAETAQGRADLRYDLEGEDEDAAERDLQALPPLTRRRARIKRDRLPLMLLLLLVMILPFLTEVLHVADSPPETLDAESQPLADAVAGLRRSSKPVLVAFEYNPTGAQELDPLVEAVLRDILARRGTVVAISTQPLGTLHAEHVLSALAADDALPRNSRYHVLPFLSGGAVGVRSLAINQAGLTTHFTRDIHNESTGLEVEQIADEFAFMIVVAERSEEARIWAEQFAEVPLTKYLLVAAGAEPMARPYFSAGAYAGLLSGVKGAITYDLARNTDNITPYQAPDNLSLPDPTLSRWHSMSLTALVAALVIGLGALVNVVRVVLRRRKA